MTSIVDVYEFHINISQCEQKVYRKKKLSQLKYYIVLCNYLIKNHVIPSPGSDMGIVIESRVIV